MYTYNDVALKSIRYPTMRTTSYDFDRAGRVKLVTAAVLGFPAKTYVSAIDYAAHGAVEQMSLGAGARKERNCYNNRLQMVGMVVGESPAADCASASNTLLRLYNQYGPNNNGNMTGQQIADHGSWLASQTFTYDKLNRLESAMEGTTATGWKQTFGYDRWGNRWVDSNPANTYGLNLPGVANGPSWFTGKNRLQNLALDGQGTDVGFDASGNQRYLAPFTATYDGENRMVEATSTTSGAQSYRYDGEGRRVKKIVGADTTAYQYDALGNLAVEYDTRTPLPAQHCITCYVAVDHLGSTRALWDDSGLKARFDYLPFGEAIPSDRSNRTTLACAPGVSDCYNGPGGLTQKFTGKERDAETGLDYFGARYMSAAQGRFTSPDPLFFQKEMIVDPQRWNLYAYVRNNPLGFVDPTGERIELTGETEEERKRQLAAIQGAVGAEAGARLSIQEDKKTGQFFVGITGDVSTFRDINSAASTFATIIGLNEVAKFDVVGSAERLNISWKGEDGSPQNTLMQARAEGATGRDATGQLWVYVKRPIEGYSSVEASKMGNWFFGGFRDQATVVGHEFGHGLGFMMQRLVGQPTNSNATNGDALSLENKVRQVRRPGSQPRLKH